MVVKIKGFLQSIKDFIEVFRRERENAAQNAKAAGAGHGSSQEVAKSQDQAGATSKKTGVPAEVKGHGAPVYAAPTQSSMNLKLPEKKRKPGQAPSPSPGPEVVITSAKPGSKSIVNARPGAAQMHNLPPPPPALPSKCPIPTCSHHVSGFATDAEADKHAASEHKYTGTALNWMLETLKSALGIAGDTPKSETFKKAGKLDSVKLAPTNAAGMSAAPSNSSLSAIVAMDISKVASNSSIKAPQNHQSYRMQQSSTKAGSPSGAGTSIKRTVGALGDGAAEGSPSKKPAVMFEDSWTVSLVTREAIHDSFDGLPELMQGTSKNTSEIQSSVHKLLEPVGPSELAPQIELPVNLKPTEHTLQPLLSGLPSPPPITWDDTPESADGNASPKHDMDEPNDTTTTTKKLSVPLSEWAPFEMQMAPQHNQYSLDVLPDLSQMDWQDSGVGMDAYEFDPQAMVQQMYMYTMPPPDSDLDALLAQEQLQSS